MKLRPHALGICLALMTTVVPADPPTPNPVTFRETAPTFFLGDNQKVKVTLSAGSRIYPVSKEVAFIFGTLNVLYHGYQSLMLRSEDSGQSWREVDMRPIFSRGIRKVFFVNENTGWFVTGWGPEGSGEMLLYGTNDAGKSWESRSNIMWFAPGSWPVRIKFYDEQHGQLILYHDRVSASDDGIEIKETTDGGKTWESVVRLELGLIAGERQNLESGESTSIGLITDEIFRQLNEQLSEKPKAYTEAPDGSQWRITKFYLEEDGTRRERGLGDSRADGRTFISVQRRLDKEAAWEERAFIPELYEMSNDSPVPAPVTTPKTSEAN